MPGSPLPCRNCAKLVAGTPRPSATWCAAYQKPAVRVVNLCIKERRKEPLDSASVHAQDELP